MNFATLTDYTRTPEDDANDAAEAAWKQRRNADSLRALQSRLAHEARQRTMNHLTATEPAHQLSHDMTEEPEELAALHDASTKAVPVGQVEVTSVGGVVRHEFEPVLMIPPGTTPLYAMQFFCPVTSWQPIATAPKQGQVLLRWPGQRDPCVGSWCPDSSARTPAPYWSGDTDRWIGVRETRKNQPTHWMPLPA